MKEWIVTEVSRVEAETEEEAIHRVVNYYDGEVVSQEAEEI